MLSLLKNNSPFVFILLFIFAVLAQLKTVFGDFDFGGYDTLPLFSQIFFGGVLANKSLWGVAGFLLLFTIVILGQISAIQSRYALTGHKNFMPAFFFVFFIAALPSTVSLLQMLIAGIFLLGAIQGIINSQMLDISPFKYFNAGLFISVGTFFYGGLIFFYPVILLSFFSIRGFSGREVLASLLGIFVPFIIVYSLEYILLDVVNFDIFKSIVLKVTHLELGINRMISIALLTLFLIPATLVFMKNLPSLALEVRKKNTFFLLIGLLSILIFLLLPVVSFEALLMVALPGVFILSVFFSNTQKKMLTEIFFLIFFFILVYSQTNLGVKYLETLF